MSLFLAPPQKMKEKIKQILVMNYMLVGFVMLSSGYQLGKTENIWYYIILLLSILSAGIIVLIYFQIKKLENEKI